MKDEILIPVGSDSDLIPTWVKGIVYKHECSACECEFYEWSGGLKVKGENEHYCPNCVKNNLHYAHIRDYCETLRNSSFEANKIINSLIGC